MKDILYIDDSSFDRSAFERLMRKFPNREYDLATSVPEMEERLANSSYRVCIRDFYIPGESEIDLDLDKEMYFISGSQHALNKLASAGISAERLILKPLRHEQLAQIINGSSILSTTPDLGYIDELSDGDDAFKQHMISVFIEEVPVQLKTALAFLEEREFVQLADTVHALQTKIRTFGLNDINEIADELEEQARYHGEEQEEQLMVWYNQINEALLETVQILKSE